MMELITELIEKQEVAIEKLLKTRKKDYKESLVVYIIKHSEDIALLRSKFRCEKCKKKEFLQYHHLVGRGAKHFMPLKEYIILRYQHKHWVIVCWKCHEQVHGLQTKGCKIPHKPENNFISKEKIERTKQKLNGWGVEENKC